MNFLVMWINFYWELLSLMVNERVRMGDDDEIKGSKVAGDICGEL